ncbi:MAG: YebC/PmpR family DNA-binding transcriptional regulator, partial [Actinomycetota bacterium]
MSGHSKWATIKRKKAVIDQKKGKTFAKLARQIDVAARQGGGDPAANAALRTIIQKAKAASMTNDAIDRAIKRATGEAQGANYEAITYEAYAPGGVALLIDILTDNRNRTASDVRAIFSKIGGSMAAPGAVAWQFSRKGVILVDRAAKEDDVMNAVLEHGADDMSDDGSVWRVTCDATKVWEVKAALEA